MTTAKVGDVYRLPYITCRNITAPEDDADGRKVYSGHVRASAVLSLEDNENVREYLVDAPGKKKNSPTLVHQAIRKTLDDHPDQFSVLNGGMVLVARAAEVDDKGKVISLTDASIINGSQTQGELRRYFAKHDGVPPADPSLKFELIVTNDADLIAEISIARNFQNDVRAISIAGRRGQLDELESAIQVKYPDAKLRMSETDIVSDGEFLDTEKLIQTIFAIMPERMMRLIDPSGDPTNKVFTYSQKTRCLKLFQRLVDNPGEVYECCLDLAPIAWELYGHWKSHQGFKGTRIRSIDREDGKIIDVPDGFIFPILAAHAPFLIAVKDGDGKHDDGVRWIMNKPSTFSDAEMIDAAKQAYMEIADHNPQTMGKSKACYSALIRITSIYAKFAQLEA